MKVNQNRSLAMYIILSILTLGIYSLYTFYSIAKDVNTMCEGDGEHTPGLLMLIVLSLVTCGIYSFVWYYKLGNRLHTNGPKFGVNIQENGGTLLMWFVLGSLLCFIATFVGINIIFRNCNMIAAAYNNGGSYDDFDTESDDETYEEDYSEEDY